MPARRLSYRQVLEIVAGKPVQELVLVGGQALNAWAEALGIADHSTEGIYGAALSDDIDFYGMAPAAIALAEALGAAVAVAGMDQHTPNAAVITFDYHGDRNIIDVLHSLQGFSSLDLERVRQWAAVPEMPGAASDKLRVMHPAHCLQSQLENVYGAALNRRESADGERNANRVRLACEAVRRTLRHYLDSDDAESGRALVELVYSLAGREPALRARASDQIDIAAGFVMDERLGSAFVAKRLPQLEASYSRAIGKYEARLRRKRTQ